MRVENTDVARRRLAVVLLIVAIVFSATSIIAAYSFSTIRDFEFIRPSSNIAVGDSDTNLNIIVNPPGGGSNG